MSINNLSKKDVLAMYCNSMEQPAMQYPLKRSFRQWANLRDELALQYSALSGIPVEEFHSAYAIKNAEAWLI